MMFGKKLSSTSCQKIITALCLSNHTTSATNMMISMSIKRHSSPLNVMKRTLCSAAEINLSKGPQLIFNSTLPSSHLLLRAHTSNKTNILQRHTTSLNTLFCRFKSDSLLAALPAAVPPPGDFIPEPPSVVVDTVVEQLSNLGEPALSSLGLGCWHTPSGLAQNLIECIHVYADVSWAATLVIFAVSLRCVIAPVQAYGLKLSTHQHNVAPKYMEYKSLYDAAAARGDTLQAQMLQAKIEKYQIEHNVKPLKGLYGMMFQGLVVCSVAYGLRQMANLPVESMTTGGAFWITDLTVGDPLFLMPFITAFSILLIFEIGSEGYRSNLLSSKKRWGMRVFIMAVIPLFLINASSATTLYLMTSNLAGICTMAIIKAPLMKNFVGIPDTVKLNPIKRKTVEPSFYEQVTSRFKKSTINWSASDKESINAKAFATAALSKRVKTYKHNPTKDINQR